MHIGIGTRPKKGESHNGDGYFVEEYEETVILGVIDGIGHGETASGISERASAILCAQGQQPPASLIEACHRELLGSRGAVMGLAMIDRKANQLTYAGVGNIRARIIRQAANDASHQHQSKTEHLTSMNGIVGYNLKTARDFRYPCQAGDTLVMFSDGISSRMDLFEFLPATDLQAAAEKMLQAHGKDDDATILLARV